MKKFVNTLLKILVSVTLFGIILWKIDKQSLLENIKLLDFQYAPLIILLLILNYVFGAVRWKKLLIYENTHHITVRYLAKLYFMGAFFNNFMPTSVGGDVFKVFKLGKKIENNANAFSATFMERFTGIIALVLVSYFGLIKTLDFWISQLPPAFLDNALLTTFFKVFLFLGFWIAVFAGFLALKLFAKRISFLEKVYRSLVAYKDSTRVLLFAFVTSFAIQFFAIFTQYFVYKAVGVSIPIDYALFIFPVITLAGFFIPSLNGIGVQDFLYMELFKIIGIPPTISLSASIIYHLFRLGVSLIGGVFYAVEKEE